MTTPPNTTGAQALSDALRAFVDIKPLGYGAPGTRDMDMAQWNEAHRAATVCIEALSSREQAGAVSEEKWYAVLSPSRNQGVIFKDRSDADWTAKGHRQFGVPTIGEAFREAYERDAKEFTRIEVAAPGAAVAAREQGASSLAPVPYDKHEAEVLEVIAERDRYHEMADQLAAQIAVITKTDIGEHSSDNDPWRNALMAAEELLPLREQETIARFLERTGQYVTNDASREAAIAEAVQKAIPSKGAQDVLAERQRQISAEGWTTEHDDEHDKGEIAYAGAAYALRSIGREWMAISTWKWTGWDARGLKGRNPRRCLVKAAALILAELERIDRAALASREEAPEQSAKGLTMGGEDAK